MALRLVNTTPGDVVEPLLPGRPAVFGIRSSTGHVSMETFSARVGFTNATHSLENGVAVLPEANKPLLYRAEVSLASPEHVQPASGEINRFANGPDLRMGPGPSAGVTKSVYEVTSEIEAYRNLLSYVTFRVRTGWQLKTFFWCNATNVAPLYLGFEYGVRNTGLFAFLRDNGSGGSIVVGGPLQAMGTARPAQVEIPLAWTALPDLSKISIFFFVDGESQTIQLWRQLPSDPGPVPFGPVFSLNILGVFHPNSSSFPQRRVGPSDTARLYFGNVGGTSDMLDVSDFGIYRNFSRAVGNGDVWPDHTFERHPDLPFLFQSSVGILPTAPALGRWTPQGIVKPVTQFWFQPGRKSEPLYTEIVQEKTGAGYLRRLEPRLAERVDGFSVEAWMAGSTEQLTNIESGFGFRVGDGQRLYQVSALEQELIKTYGIFKDTTYQGELAGYWTKTLSDGTVAPADHSSLRLVRLTVDRHRNSVDLYVEDPNKPFLSTPLASAFPPSAGEAFVDIGVLTEVGYATRLKLAALNYLTRYLAWEVGDGLPETAPAAFAQSLGGSGTASIQSGALRLDKESYGPGIDNHLYYKRAGDFTFLRGFQVDFRCRVSLYADKTGTSDVPNLWTGAGVTIFLGTSESPNARALKLHVGFFDCGPYGRKVAIVPNQGYDDIIQQTERGKKHSADLEWMRTFGGGEPMQNLRLVYHPFRAIELWGQGLVKDEPILSIPWDEFEHEHDLQTQSPGIAFGNFASEINCVSEWQYVRWGVSTGYEVAISQAQPDPSTVLGGKALLMIDVNEEP